MLPKSRDRVFHYVLERRAVETPGKPFLVMRDRSLSYAQANAAINRLAAGFAAEGLARGDRVLVMMPSGIDYILVWQALCKIGALMVPVNDAYQGRMLANQVVDADAVMAVVAPRFLERWRDPGAGVAAPATIVVYGDAGGEGPVGSARLIGFDTLPRGDGSNPPQVVEYVDPAAILYTSGTTGPSKGVLYGHAHAYATAAPLAEFLGPADVFYMFLPMFHTGLPHVFGTVLISGGTLAIREKFSTSEFWEDVRRFGATSTLLISTMPAYLMSAPSDPRDGNNGLRTIFMTPLLKDIDAFKDRFGCRRIVTLFNMTEASTPLITSVDLVNAQTCGRPRPGISARIVDENDESVAPGVVGELVLRADDPWEFNLGYWRNPEKTAEAWRNQWLHTGDLLSKDAAGNYYFKDRLKDAIRRRGENISSFELESEVKAHPAIAECAAVAVPSPMGEDEVKIVVSLFPDAQLDGPTLIDFLVPRLPAYMVPRYVEFRDELPKTPTGKIQKMTLRKGGNANAWDREASGRPGGPSRKPA
ncbi:MAG: AMP-binding protein [Mesorhizobium sp.]|nr:AMP-binding protein [Mesorhizobium sp.]MCO5164122.1 AMP-binding protein [Mesorhizobium sp.]